MRHCIFPLFATASLLTLPLTGALAQTDELESPVRLKAGDAVINVDVGHAAPFYADVNGDGVRDLLVGQFGDGKLRIYHNTGSEQDPKFTDHEWLKTEGDFGKIPSG